MKISALKNEKSQQFKLRKSENYTTPKCEKRQ